MNSYISRIINLLIIAVVLSSPAVVSAYYLNLEAPTEVRVGEQIHISGSTNTPPPDLINIIFSQSVNIPVEIARQPVEIRNKGKTDFNVTFDTTGLIKGNYKIEALSQTQRDFSASSKNLRVIKLIDRSDIIRFSSPSYQDYSDKLLIEARIQNYDDNSIYMEIKLENETVFGPESIPVSRGFIKDEQPIKKDGKYAITFTDNKGYIGTYYIQVGEALGKNHVSSSGPADIVKEGNLSDITIPVVETSLPPTVAVQEEPTMSTDIQVQSTPVSATNQTTKDQISSGSTVSFSTMVSRDYPAYLLIDVKGSPVTISTSDNEDWVFEYKTNAKGASVKVNDLMKKASEKVTITDSSDKIFVKAYPYSFKTSENITITSTNSGSINLSDEAAQAYGATPRYSIIPISTTKSPVSVFGIILGMAGAAFIFHQRKFKY